MTDKTNSDFQSRIFEALKAQLGNKDTELFNDLVLSVS